ncbi:MAG TPA: L,D-transpeptidase [Gaiellaceae bacterium]|nr:L,D-transpeptidase [Gaiellaceae bacterium]
MALVSVVAAVLAFADRGTEASEAGGSGQLAAAIPEDDPLAPPPRPGLVVPRPELLPSPAPDVSLWAPVRRPLELRDAPSAGGRIVARVPVSTPEGTENLVLVTGRTLSEASRLWVPVRTTEATGWAPRRALGGYETVDTRLVVDTRAFSATLLRASRVVFRARIGVGTANAPTPTGSFYVRNRLTRFRSAFYGPVAFGTSARSTLTDWPAGGFVGIHGTSRPELLPGRVSHGCIRMRNADILELARLMPVGTPVEIT